MSPSAPAPEAPPEARPERELIAALASGPGPAAIAILRLSGAGSLAAARRFLVGLPEAPPPRKLLRALAVHADNEPLDDVLTAVFPAPHSYTGEGMVEVHCHGGPAVAAAVQEAAMRAGARLALPGEFTERAVLNGKMDLLAAEALAALLEADGNDELRRATAAQALAPRLRELAGRVRGALAGARGDLDYPLELAGQAPPWRKEASEMAEALGALLAPPDLEKTFREGILVVLLGPPNAGKSSLFNALLAEERALVDSEPGTTRDAQRGGLFLKGRRFTIVDTAGLRESPGGAQSLEARAVARSLQVSEAAQVVIWVEDGSAVPTASPRPVDLHVLAKADLAPHAAREAAGDLRVSALTGQGIAELATAIQRLAPRSMAVLSQRQQRLVGVAQVALRQMALVTDDEAAEHLALADKSLGELVGDRAGTIDTSEIYARFCVGK